VRNAGAVIGSRRLIRCIAAAVLAVVVSLAAWWLVARGVRTDDFPAFLASQSVTPITRYSGPWLTAAAGAMLVAALLLMSAVFDLVRWSRGTVGRSATNSAELNSAGLSSSALSSAQ
jgi:hypothetical protein